MPDARPRRAHPRAAGAAPCCALATLAVAAGPARAQLPGLPAAQSAFPAPGLAVALNGGRENGRTVGSVAGATGVRRLQLTAALGLPGAPAGFDRRGVSYAARLAARVYRSPRLSAAAFAGYGKEQLRSEGIPVPTGADGVTLTHPVGAFAQVPVGVSAGVRGLAGARPYALSLAPMFVYTRWRISDGTRTRSGARVAALAEVAVTPRIAVGVAAESGVGGPGGSPYTSGRRTVFGAGLSYAIRRVVAR